MGLYLNWFKNYDTKGIFFSKKNRENVLNDFFQFIMEGDGKTPLKNAILLSFLSLIQIKKKNTVKHFKNVCTGP